MRSSVGLTAFVLVLGMLALVSCGEEGERAGALAWEGEPRLITPSSLPDDRILTGSVKNESLEVVELSAGEITLEDAEGDPVEGSAVFLSGYAHGLYPPTREPESLPDTELERTGRKLSLAPNEDPVPLTVSWRQPAGSDPPVAIRYQGQGSLPIPSSP